MAKKATAKSTRPIQPEKREACRETGPEQKHDPDQKSCDRVDDPGDLDEEELNRDAPYNRTYGVEESSCD